LISQNNSPSLNAMRLRIHLLFSFGHIFLSLKSPKATNSAKIGILLHFLVFFVAFRQT
jgi:hypothetical protein